jgi:membrane protein YqaA with SNARE-associated domain
LFNKLTAFLVGLGSWSILLVAFIDSAGVPLTVGLDLLVVLLSARQPAWAAWWVTLAVVGSSAGNLLLFQASVKGGRKMLKDAPQGRQKRFREWFHRYGLVTVFVPALTPIPLPMKVFVICAGMFGVRQIEFLGVILLARTLRYGSEAYLGVQMGENSNAFLNGHWKQLTAAAALLTIVLFVLVYWNGERRKRLAQNAPDPADAV